MKCGNVVEICLWTHLAVKGLSGYQAFDTLSLVLIMIKEYYNHQI